MEITDTFEQKSPELQITETAKKHLKTTSSWTNFYAILSFISIGFMLLSGITTLISGSFLRGFSDYSMYMDTTALSSMSAFIGILYVLMAVVMFFPALYLFRYGKSATTALAENNTLALEDSIKNMKSYWKFIGIMAIISIVLCIIAISIMLIGIAFAM